MPIDYWYNANQTFITRPENLGDKGSYTLDGACALETTTLHSDFEETTSVDPNRAPPGESSVILFQVEEGFTNTRINLTQTSQSSTVISRKFLRPTY